MTRTRRRVAVGTFFAAMAAVAGYVLYGSAAELTEAGQALTKVTPWWLILAGAVEFASFVAYAQGQRIFLSAADRYVPLPAMTGIVTAGQAIANVIPAGVAAASVYTFRQLLLRRISILVSGEVQVAQSLVYVGSLAVLALAGVGVAGGTGNVPDLPYVAVGLLVLTGVLITLGVWLQRRGSIARAFGWAAARVPGHTAHHDWRGHERQLDLTPRIWGGAGLAGLSTWVLDCACLAASFAAVGAAVPWRGLLLAYCAGQIATMLPISPGGLGVVEGSLTLALVAFGGSEVTTLAAVLLYRLFSYWAVLPSGLVSHLLVRIRPDAEREAS